MPQPMPQNTRGTKIKHSHYPRVSLGMGGWGAVCTNLIQTWWGKARYDPNRGGGGITICTFSFIWCFAGFLNKFNQNQKLQHVRHSNSLTKKPVDPKMREMWGPVTRTHTNRLILPLLCDGDRSVADQKRGAQISSDVPGPQVRFRKAVCRVRMPPSAGAAGERERERGKEFWRRVPLMVVGLGWLRL